MKKSIMYLSYNTKYGAEKNDLYFFNFLKRKLYVDLFLLSDNFKAGYSTVNKWAIATNIRDLAYWN